MAMKILLVAAVRDEINALFNNPRLQNQCTPLITGPGIPATLFYLSKWLHAHQADVIVNAGLCGSFSSRFPLGTVVHVKRDCFGDLGAENKEGFIHVSDLAFEKANPSYTKYISPGELSFPCATLRSLKSANAITVNKVLGNESSIQKVKNQFNPDIESMEGAAVCYVGQKESIPVVQVRAVSNLVENRDKSKWETEKATLQLAETVSQLINELAGSDD